MATINSLFSLDSGHGGLPEQHLWSGCHIAYEVHQRHCVGNSEWLSSWVTKNLVLFFVEELAWGKGGGLVKWKICSYAAVSRNTTEITTSNHRRELGL